jgi:hypothetical protein
MLNQDIARVLKGPQWVMQGARLEDEAAAT